MVFQRRGSTRSGCLKIGDDASHGNEQGVQEDFEDIHILCSVYAMLMRAMLCNINCLPMLLCSIYQVHEHL